MGADLAWCGLPVLLAGLQIGIINNGTGLGMGDPKAAVWGPPRVEQTARSAPRRPATQPHTAPNPKQSISFAGRQLRRTGKAAAPTDASQTIQSIVSLKMRQEQAERENIDDDDDDNRSSLAPLVVVSPV